MSEEVPPKSSTSVETASCVIGFWGVRYQVADIGRSVDFYTNELGFKLDVQRPPAFAQVSLDGLKLVLSGPGASGSRPTPARPFHGFIRRSSISLRATTLVHISQPRSSPSMFRKPP